MWWWIAPRCSVPWLSRRAEAWRGSTKARLRWRETLRRGAWTLLWWAKAWLRGWKARLRRRADAWLGRWKGLLGRRAEALRLWWNWRREGWLWWRELCCWRWRKWRGA